MPELRQRQDDAMQNMTEQKQKIKAIKGNFFLNSQELGNNV